MLLREAVERGYYDTPRRVTLVELAEELDIAKSTCSEILHRVEEQVLKRFLKGDCEHQPDISIHAVKSDKRLYTASSYSLYG